MTVGERTLLFNICVIVFNVVLGLLIEGFLIFSLLFFLAGASESVQQSVPVGVVLPFVLIVGLFACIAISRKCVIWAIDRFDLREKLDSKLTARYPRKI